MPNKVKRSRAVLFAPDSDATQDAHERAENISYLPMDEARAASRSANIRKAWHEYEYNKLADEQVPLHTAEGVQEARPYDVAAARLKIESKAGQKALSTSRDMLHNAKADLQLTYDALAGCTRREPHAYGMYITRWSVLVLGDVAGIGGAAVLLGEIPALAVLQATASAIAAVTAGLVGTDIRDARLARRRARDTKEIKPEHQNFAWVLSGADAGEKIVKAMIAVAITITLLLGAGIFTLRAGVEGFLGGAVFGCLAVAICLASAINSYNYADEIADLIAGAETRHKKALKRYTSLAASKAIARHKEAQAMAASIKDQHRHLGIAGRLHLLALKNGISRNNPGVMGHGPAPAKHTTDSERYLFPELDIDFGGHSSNGTRAS